MRPYVTDLRCPACQGRIKEPLSRFSGPVTYLHHRGRNRRACRLLITPDPDGHSHSVQVVDPGTSLEEALERAIREYAEAAA